MDKFWPLDIYQIIGTMQVNATNITHKSEQKNWAYKHVKQQCHIVLSAVHLSRNTSI